MGVRKLGRSRRGMCKKEEREWRRRGGYEEIGEKSKGNVEEGGGGKRGGWRRRVIFGVYIRKMEIQTPKKSHLDVIIDLNKHLGSNY